MATSPVLMLTLTLLGFLGLAFSALWSATVAEDRATGLLPTEASQRELAGVARRARRQAALSLSGALGAGLGLVASAGVLPF